MNTLNLVTTIVFALLGVAYTYQFVYVLIVWAHDYKEYRLKKSGLAVAEPECTEQKRYAFVIAARNESSVIGNLIDSIKRQDYPSDKIDVFVVADNCTDDTASIASLKGAIVFERFNKVEVGKSYALDYCFSRIDKEYGGYDAYDGYFIFDADNIISKNYVTEMNKVFCQGHKVVTSYRNSKNYDTNWITSGYSLWFLREAKYLNNARVMTNNSCAVSGTGYLFDSSLLYKYGGWKFNLLTEDIQFSTVNILDGEKIGFAMNAMFYDEQPTTFRQSWTQRMRWSKGFYQVIWKHGLDLIKGIFTKKKMFFSCYDMLMTLAPATLLTLGLMLVNAFYIILAATSPEKAMEFLPATGRMLAFQIVQYYVLMFVVGLITTISEWNKIVALNSRKILAIFTFPLFMLTYIPISIVALFKKVEWKPIKHNITTSLDDLETAKVRINK